jgi:hypothetical protein
MNKKVLIAEDQFVEETMEKGGVHFIAYAAFGILH